MTREELEAALAKIGWRISKSGNGLNDYIINHEGEKTRFVVDGDRLEIRQNLFGGESSLGKGNCHFELQHMTITEGGDNGKAEFVTLDFSKECFIQFFNHDK